MAKTPCPNCGQAHMACNRVTRLSETVVQLPARDAEARLSELVSEVVLPESDAELSSVLRGKAKK